jgi:hypothetical protein
MYKILWLSDIELDYNYTAGASTQCEDYACCHPKDHTTFNADMAAEFGSKSCYHGLQSFKKMVDSINYYNTSEFMNIATIIVGGSNVAPVPDHMTNEIVKIVHHEIFKYLRFKFPHVGIYFTVGPNDFYPPNY